jgi:hypothetical protein
MTYKTMPTLSYCQPIMRVDAAVAKTKFDPSHRTFLLRPDLDVLYLFVAWSFPKRAEETARFYQTNRWCGCSVAARDASAADRYRILRWMTVSS